MQGNVLGQVGGSGSSGLNVFAQLAEPSKKDGIWIKTEKTEKYIFDKLADIPFNFTCEEDLAVVGNNIYFFSSSNDNNHTKYNYKYNILTNTYIKIADVPYVFFGGLVATVSTDIYLFGNNDGTNSYNKTYKYNTITNTYTKLADIPYSFVDGLIIAIGNDIYLFSSAYETNNTYPYSKKAYKYNVLTNEYTQLTDIPSEFVPASILLYDNVIYIAGIDFTDFQEYIYKYDIENDEYIELTNAQKELIDQRNIVVGNYAYIFHSSSAYKLEIKTLPAISKYKYNKVELTNKIDSMYQKLTNIPYPFYEGSVATVGTNIYIYIFGGSSSTTGDSQTNYKYNMITDTYTYLKNIPYTFINGSAVAVGTNIYLFGGNSFNKYAYRYDTLTDTYIQLANIPFNFVQGFAVAIGTNIYLLGSSEGNHKYNYKYDTLTNTYTKLTDIPVTFYQASATVVGTNIYLFGGLDSASNTKSYKYDTLTNTYTQLIDMSYGFTNGSAITIGTNIYLLGSSSSSYYNNAYKYNVTIRTNKNIYIETISVFKTKLTKTLETYFSNAQIYDNDKLLPYPVYYGNGQEWVKIEN